MSDAEKQKEMDGGDAYIGKLVRQEEMDGSSALIEQTFFKIKFQLGPVKEFGVNGCQMEDVLAGLIQRLEGFQRGPFNCRDNALAITKLQEAVFWLEHRTQDRRRRGVEGKNEA